MKKQIKVMLISCMFLLNANAQSNPYIEMGNRFIRDGCAKGAKSGGRFAKLVEQAYVHLIAETKPNSKKRNEGAKRIMDLIEEKLDEFKIGITKEKQKIARDIYAADEKYVSKDLLIRQLSVGLDSEYSAFVNAAKNAQKNSIEGKERSAEFYEMEAYSECLQDVKLN